jgi:hypothetical protein
VNGPAGELRCLGFVRNIVMVYDEYVVRSEMDIELDTVSPKLHGPEEGGNGVFGALLGRPTMGDDLYRRHGGSIGIEGAA